MLFLQINKVFPLSTKNCSLYQGITYDGCHFYLTDSKNKEIIQFDSCFCQKECFVVCRSYTAIAYDSCQKCFWAITKEECQMVYKLDECFREIDCLKILFLAPTTISGIACDLEDGKLLISCTEGIAKISKTKDPVPYFLKKSPPCLQFNAVASEFPYYLTAFDCNNSGSGIAAYSNCNELQLQCFLSDEYTVLDMCSAEKNSCKNNCDKENKFYILALKNQSYSYILECTFSCIIEENCINQKGCPGKCHCCKKTCKIPPNHTDCCTPCCMMDCCDGFAGIIQSIALIETALSHILNAEGEKIQKILEISNSPKEIITVNDSVNKTIVNITHLEQVLYTKLQLAQEMMDDECNKKC